MNLKDALQKYVVEKGLTAKITERNITIDKIVDYVNECAKTELNGQNGAISDEVVYGWVVHYIEDAYKETEKEESVEVEANDNQEEEPKPVEREHEKYEQLDLFEALKG